MRILHIRFKNLNSLIGEWKIDLTHPAFASDGIFAITGPTGAGKTTILDAICLALYGKTPRLNKISKSENEIMSQQTGECFAEVIFETHVGQFRCHWSQRRARKNPDGELQIPRHEISDANTGIIVKTKSRGVAEQIVIATGMDFDRFTRSMLLAQGGFAAFLQATPDERTPILEQITGTTIYSHISKRVHERHTKEQDTLNKLSLALGEIELLSEEDEQNLTVNIEKKLLQETELNKHIAENNVAIAWLDRIATLKKDLGSIKEQKQNWQIRQEAFQAEREKLRRALQALELAGEHTKLISLRHENEIDYKNYTANLQTLPELEIKVKNTEEAVKQTNINLEKKKAEQKDAQLVIRKVRNIDPELREKNMSIEATNNTISGLVTEFGSLKSKNDETCIALSTKKKELEDVLKYLAKAKTDENLVEQLSGILSQFDTLKNSHQQHSDKQEEFRATEIQSTETTRIANEQAKNLVTEKNKLTDIQNIFNQKQAKLKDVLQNQEIAGWRNNLSIVKEKKSVLEKASATLQSLVESSRILDELNTSQHTLAIEKISLAEQLQSETEKRTNFEQQISLFETQLLLLKKIETFEEARCQLQDDKPCPLCGATEHPFVKGNVPLPDQTITALNQEKGKLKIIADSISDLNIKQTKTTHTLESNDIKKKELNDKIAAYQALINQNCVNLSIAMTSNQDLNGTLLRLQKENLDNLENAEKIVKTAEELEKEISTQRESLEKMNVMIVQLESVLQSITHKKKSNEQAIERIKKESNIIEGQLKKIQNEIEQTLLPYGIQNPSIKSLDQMQDELIKRRTQWLTWQKEKLEHERNISILSTQIHGQTEQLNKFENDLKKQHDLFNTLRHKGNQLARERHELFGDKNPDDEESRFSSEIEIAEKTLSNFIQASSIAVNERNKLRNRIEELEKSIASRSSHLKTADDAFITRLTASNFPNESHYLDACLSEEERNKLTQQAQKLDSEQTEIATKENDRENTLTVEQQKQLTNQSQEEIKKISDNLLNNLKVLQQEVGGIQQQLKENDKLKQQQLERKKELDLQKKECSRWENLHQLIGSADGKKYRNFAQGLTFEMMVGYANKQLQKMMDRYLLIRDDAQPLELNVIDNYQAGETRSTKNLSGGESFIVSLSLALGLSHMASKNVRIDSLFLDEGFGSLDEEALEVALETLAGLQQSGKMIGIISHVPALKERISTQIQVIPQASGRSILSGPGCDNLPPKEHT